MDISNLLRIEYRGEPVLTSKQLASAYHCEVKNINRNFNYNKDKFVAGVHYYKLVEEELRAFKAYLAKLEAAIRETQPADIHEDKIFLPAENGEKLVAPSASSLILWTKEGAIRLCKMLGTEEAWEMFAVLEKSYFTLAKIAKDFTARVYAFAMSDNTVKIGVSGNVDNRVKTVEYETHLQVTDVFSLKVESRQRAFEIEAALHKHFAAQCVQGEFFSINFEDACNEIEKLVAAPETPNLDFEKLQFLNEFIKNCAVVTDLNLRDELIKTAFDILKNT